MILILLDDVGFGATSTFGGPVATPFLNELAQSGLRYNRFHVNSLLFADATRCCSPTATIMKSASAR
ncbi:MAG: sulfatase-like hydrolase/transferase [Bryobacteraceae bacterium]